MPQLFSPLAPLHRVALSLCVLLFIASIIALRGYGLAGETASLAVGLLAAGACLLIVGTLIRWHYPANPSPRSEESAADERR